MIRTHVTDKAYHQHRFALEKLNSRDGGAPGDHHVMGPLQTCARFVTRASAKITTTVIASFPASVFETSLSF